LMRTGNEKFVEQNVHGLIIGDRVLMRVRHLSYPPRPFEFILSPA
jgi:hypothetical protein